MSEALSKKFNSLKRMNKMFNDFMYKGSFQFQWKEQLQNKETFFKVLKEYISQKEMFQRLSKEDKSLNELLEDSDYLLRLFKNNLHNEMKRQVKSEDWYKEKIEAWDKNMKSKKKAKKRKIKDKNNKETKPKEESENETNE